MPSDLAQLPSTNTIDFHRNQLGQSARGHHDKPCLTHDENDVRYPKLGMAESCRGQLAEGQATIFAACNAHVV